MMKSIPDDRQLYVSGRIWHEILPKIDFAPFIYALHEGIDLTKYGDGLQKFYFTFLILLPESKMFPPGTYFSRKKRSAEIAVAIDYDEAFDASPPELVKMMETAYLEGVDLIKTLPLQSPFDVDAFKQDVQAIFAQDKWYEVAMEAG